jgi:outer membrane protein assembly factor BamB
MAPEQFRGKARPASDQYALGIVIYEWICGDYPFHGSFPELYSQHLFIPPPPLHEKVPDIPPAVEQVIMKALAKEPQQRFPRVLDLAYALQHAVQPQEMTYSTMPPTGSGLQISEDDILTLPSARKATFNEPSQHMTSGSEQNFANTLQQTSPSPQIEVHKGPYVDNVQQAPLELPSQAPFIAPIITNKSRQALSSNKIVLVIGLALLVVVGSVALLSSSLLKGITAPPSTATVSTTGGHSTSSSPPPAYSPMFGYNLDHTRYNPVETTLGIANVSKLMLSWTAATVSAIYSSPVVANGIVYISSTDHYLYAFDRKAGTLLWKAATTSIDGASFIFSTPTVVNGVLYIGSTDHNLYAFNASGCGKPVCSSLWAAPTGDAIYSSPAVANGVVYIGSYDHNLYAFNASNGAQLWKAATGDMIVSSPAVDNGVVYVGSFDHKFYAFSAATGKMLWMASTGYKINSSPTISNGVVYVGSDDHNLYAFNASGCGKLICTYLWVGPTESYIYSSPAVANGMVYIGSHDGLLYAFKAAGCGSASCSPLWTATTGGAIESSPAVANGVIYIGSWDHKLYAFNATTGAVLWNYSTGDQITSSSPVVIDGVVYVGSIDHKLYAFSLRIT